MAESLLRELKYEIDERQEELDCTLKALEKDAALFSELSKWFRVSIIFLGALVATKGIFPQDDTQLDWVKGFYTFCGVLIATLSGAEASFGFQKRSLDGKKLATECKSYILDIDCKIPQDDQISPSERVSNMRELLNAQNKALNAIQTKAAEIGINIMRHVRKLGYKNQNNFPNSARPEELPLLKGKWGFVLGVAGFALIVIVIIWIL